MKKFGIFLAYPPTTEMRGEGLGRHLAYLLKGAAQRSDIRFVVACPSWTVASLRALCEAEHVPLDSFELLAPAQLPISLRVQAFLKATLRRWTELRRRPRAPRRRWLSVRNTMLPVERFLVSTRNMLAFVALTIALAVAAIAGVLLVGTAWSVRAAMRQMARPLRRTSGSPRLARMGELARLLSDPASHSLGRAMYRTLEGAEAELLLARIHDRNDVDAWYCPTAFWPSFNSINRPRLVCVPDVVLTRLPLSFALATGALGEQVYIRMKETIENAPHLVTYSEDIKWQTLVAHFACDADKIHVIRHGNNDLRASIAVTGTPYDREATREFCRVQLADAMIKATNVAYTHSFANRDFRFIFSPNQVRHNKNVMSLLRAYEHLLRHCGLPHKLVMTGDVDAVPEARQFIAERGLGKDVLCLRGLTVAQLAACYALAEVAVNPSLFEGGFPFTLTEALSVGTPVVLARIAVTEELLEDERVASAMLFDPYDWEDMARTIEAAIAHREVLLEAQRKAFQSVVSRTWSDVADDYFALLQLIASGGRGIVASGADGVVPRVELPSSVQA